MLFLGLNKITLLRKKCKDLLICVTTKATEEKQIKEGSAHGTLPYFELSPAQRKENQPTYKMNLIVFELNN